MRKCFLKPNSSDANMKVELNLSSYATKVDLKNATGVDTSDFAKKTDLDNLKSDKDKLDIDKLKNVSSGLNSLESKVDELNIGKLETTPNELTKISNLVKNDVVEKIEYNELVKKS